jgi:hypothetical protein
MSKDDLKAMKAAEITANDAPSVWITKTEDYMVLGLTQLEELQQITPPAGFASAHTRLLVSYERAIALSRALIQAMKADDSDAYEAAYQQGTSELYSANSAFIEALTAAADAAGVAIPQAVFQDFPTSEESLPSSETTTDATSSDTGPDAMSPELAIRGHWGAVDDTQLWVSGDRLTFKIAGDLHTATYVVTTAKTHGNGDQEVRVEEDFGGDVFAWYEDRMSDEYRVGVFTVVPAERKILLPFGAAYVEFDYVDAAETP